MLVLELVVSGLAIGLLYGLSGAAFNLIFGTTRVFDLGIGATLLIVGYVFYSLRVSAHVVAPLAILIAIVSGIGAGIVFYLAVYHQIARRARGGFFAYFVASLGILTIVSNLLAMEYGSARLFVGNSLLTGVNIGSLNVPIGDLIAIGVIAITAVALELLLAKTDIGMHFRAIAENKNLVSMLGVRAQRYWILAFALGSVLVGVDAILTVYLNGIAPSDGLVLVSLAIAAMLVGGLGSYRGALLGGAIIGVAENVAVAVVPGAWEEAVGFGVLLLVMLVRPQGLLGRP